VALTGGAHRPIPYLISTPRRALDKWLATDRHRSSSAMMRAPDRFAFLKFGRAGDFSAEYHDRHQRCAERSAPRKVRSISQARSGWLRRASLRKIALHEFAGEELVPTRFNLGNPVAPGPGGKGFYRQVQRWFHAPGDDRPVSPVRPSILRHNRRQRRCERPRAKQACIRFIGAISLNSYSESEGLGAFELGELTGRISLVDNRPFALFSTRISCGCRNKLPDHHSAPG